MRSPPSLSASRMATRFGSTWTAAWSPSDSSSSTRQKPMIPTTHQNATDRTPPFLLSDSSPRSGVPVPGVLRVDVYEWMPGGFFVLHTAYGRIGDVGGGGTEIIGFDPA